MHSTFASSLGFLLAVATLSAAVMAFAKPQASPGGGAASDPGPSPTFGARAPDLDDDKTVVLFDGKDWSNFTSKDHQPSPWRINEDGAAIATGGDAISKQTFGDFHLHIEFLCPVSDKEGQARSNSGVYLHGRYEIQVLDTFGMEAKDNHCGGIYKIATPLVNASRPAGTWQTYDVTFRSPRFDDAGKVKENPRVTVLHNGVVIHNNIELPGTTAGGIDQTMVKEGPLLLQDHGDPVQFRNIWVRRL
jgi:hypothetical protein